MGPLTGVYLHIPFCASRCHYCNFATGGYEKTLADRYVSAIEKEVHRSAPDAAFESNSDPGREWMRRVDTIYFGGGTPTTLSISDLKRILTALRKSFDICEQPEITIEANPGSVTVEYLAELREAGFNRLSFGVQSFDDSELSMIGRTHDSLEAKRSVSDARLAGFDNVSIDLIAGLPEQRRDTWERNLDEAFAMAPEHLSVYLLELYKDAPLEHRIKRGELAAINDDLTAEMYFSLDERACKNGYEHYEISNWARPGSKSRHNLKYWTGAPYWAFGVSAAGYDGRTRWSNTRNINQYLDLIEAGKSPVSEVIELSDDDQMSEAIFLRLRLDEGIQLEEYRKRFGVDIRARYSDEIERLGSAGLIEVDTETLRISRSGKILANEVFAAFI